MKMINFYGISISSSIFFVFHSSKYLSIKNYGESAVVALNYDKQFIYMNYFDNHIKNNLDSEMEKSIFDNYWNGVGDIKLSTSKFKKVKEYLHAGVNLRTGAGYDAQ